MNNLEREYIAISFNDDSSKIIPVIKMSGTDGLKKVIRSVNGISKISVYHIDFVNQVTENVGNIPWPDVALKSDVIVQYEQGRQCGTVCIHALDQVWEYSISKEQMPLQPAASIETDHRVSKSLVTDTTKNTIVDKDKVRRLEEEKKVKILWLDELAEELKKEIFGQDEAIKRISEIVATNLRRKKTEVEVIVLFGQYWCWKNRNREGAPGGT